MRGSIFSALAMFALAMPREDMPDVVLNDTRRWKGGNKLNGDLKFSRVHSGDTPYLKPQNELGRNEPCHCGSGKKHKKCCMGMSAVTE